ncbi:AraC family transcriptional regulator [Paenibacillaceae bacterium]|nr:AraC family transcriptional regulator [Paenibacillaceae bacterium]
MDFSLFPVFTDLERRLPVYITHIGGWINQSYIERTEGHVDYQWLQVTSGSGFLQADGREKTLGPGQGMLLMPGEQHAYGPLQEPWGVKWVAFNGSLVRNLLEDLGLLRTEVFYLANPDTTFKHLQEMLSLLQSPHPTTGLELSTVSYRLLLDIYRYGSRTELRSRKHQMDALSPVIHYMEENYSRTITLAELAALLGVTPQHICVLFQQALGARPIEYLTRIRIHKAKELLLQRPDTEIKTIAAQVGYEHTSYFIKLFKLQEGLTPVMFRRIHLSQL